MFTTDVHLQVLEETALLHIQSVDLGGRRIIKKKIWQALIDIPTRERRADTDFARQAAVALAMLGEHARQLSACVHTLSEHVLSTASAKN